ncbi:Streptogrisin-C precursor (Serine protease C) (SGPC) [Actinokineospora spheciospongiae]|uniref:Streptogrisin-C (Serine protease C) (SGPC) n=1 Tax=Actinokineospora spheciospongiae TaxID=909613 RepID=W7IYG7_9PSEU|nr:S1 family peptidase [Actinokineospora spheciospongiae]EWC61541.1 Streptogrisin-C precursor (Serine protease C) (SGPC) [Actinokineospora spheciospongiae]
MRRSLAGVAGLVGLAATAVVTAGQPASAAPGALVPALQRDLGLSTDQVEQRLTRESAARGLLPAARTAAGAAFGGSWFDRGSLVVALTDPALAGAVESTGARSTVVAHTARALDATKAAIDEKATATGAPKAVTGWFVDPTTNSVVLTVIKGASGAEVTSFVDGAKAAGPVRVEETTAAPRTLGGPVTGGNAYYINGAGRCSVGFSVSGGFVSAGHCGSSGDSVTGDDDSAMGTFQGSSFPGSDYSWVRTNSSWSGSPTVNGYGNGNVTVTGSSVAGVGESVCRSGSTTGWHCGTIQATDQTVNYPEGTVSGLTRTNACAEPGDSGGSWVSGSQAQGVTSGGSGDCTYGGTTYFQPVNEILSAYGLSLTTG